MFCPVQRKIEAPAAQRFQGASEATSEATPTCDHEHPRRILPLLQRHRDPSVVLRDGEPASTTPFPAPAATRRHQEGAQRASDSLWMHREQLINLFRDQDLPLRQVQDIMKREHGLDFSSKVYKSHFRKWGIRKNIKRQEALALATGQDTSPIFWADDRDQEFADRIDRHLRRNKHQSAAVSPHTQTWMEIRAARTIPRRLRAPDTLEKAEAASYYLRIYITGHHESEMWLETGLLLEEEQEAFHSMFVRGLERLSRNDREQQAFQDINRAFDQLKQLVERNHPIVYMRLMGAVGEFAQYPKSEICLKICRLLSDHIRKLSFIIHGPHHPLNHIWCDARDISSGADVEAFVLGVAVSGLKRCTAIGGGDAPVAWPIADCVPSDARGLDECSLRARLSAMASCPSLLPQLQETRLAMSELMLSQGRIVEGAHYSMEAIAFLNDDPALDAGKLFWVAELKWRSGNAMGCLETLKSALACAETEAMNEKSNGNAAKLKQEIEKAIRHKHDLLAFKKTSESGRAGRRCPVIHF